MKSILTIFFVLASTLANATGFSAAASPSRFELNAKSGEVVSRAFEIQHVGKTNTEYVIRSADWKLTPEAGLEFFDPLQANSCRPWLRLERRKVKMRRAQRRRVRFEVHVPKGTPPTECRFAILVENYDQQAVSIIPNSPVQLPLSGRLGIIVYVAIGNVKPQIKVLGVESGREGDRRLPMLRVRNEGSAHGRLDGSLKATDAKGQKFRLPVSTLPVMPGQERLLPLYPSAKARSNEPVAFRWPVKFDGRLHWDYGHFDIEGSLQ